MSNMVVFIALGIVLLPALLFVFQFYLCKKNSSFALVLPIIVACFFILFGFYALIIAAIMYGIYFVMKYVEKEKCSKQNELERMNIQDLE